MTGRLLLLVGGCSAFWLLAGLPARYLGGGDAALICSGTALLLCLVPAAATLTWSNRALAGPPDQQLVLVLGGTGLRMFFVLSAGWLLFANVPFFHQHDSFWIWLLVGYLFTLALELLLMLSGRSPAGPRDIATPEGGEAPRPAVSSLK